MNARRQPPEEVGGVWENIQLLAEWSPLLSLLKEIVAEKDVAKQAVAVTKALEWLAAKSKNKLDDELVKRVSAIVKTPEGIDLIKFVIATIEGVAK